MQKNTSRISTAFKRKLRTAITGDGPRFTYLRRDEGEVLLDAEILWRYSEGVNLTAFDPRSDSVLGHYFNPREVYRLRNAILEPNLGLVYDNSGALLAESTNWPLHQQFNSFPYIPKGIKNKLRIGEAIHLSSSGYGHWLLEDLPPTLHLLNKLPEAKILVQKNCPKYVKELLRLLDREIVFIDNPVIVDNLFIVSRNQDSGWMHPVDLREIQRFPVIANSLSHSHPNRKIYASRIKSKRSPKNELDIQKLHQEFGYEVLCLEDLGFIEEITLLSETSHLSGPHGSSFANMVYMQEHTKVLDIVNSNYWTELNHRLASVSRIQYNFETYRGPTDGPVDLELLNSKLKSIEIG